jgi:hypothetical protein
MTADAFLKTRCNSGRREDAIMKTCWKLCALALPGLFISGLTGCREEEKSPLQSMQKDAEKAASEVPKDHPAH